MKQIILPMAIAAMVCSPAMWAKAPADPVLMTVGGNPVTLGEFEYLYHKNNTQQLEPQTIDDYLQMFIVYKQKVADAKAAGIDQTEAFQKEFDGYRRDLAEPYLQDTAVEDSIIATIYERMKTDVDVSHIMVPLTAPAKSGDEQKALLDSLRNTILHGNDFGSVAVRYSSDRAAQRNKGHMGYITAGRFPYTFEDAAYATAVGEISPVIATPFGYHIVKVHGRRPARGQVLVEHILKLTQGLDSVAAAEQKEKIDSIYTLVAAGGDFEAIAAAESQDPGSARQGGKLPWFGTGQMVPEFETTAFELKDGEISKPFATSYGYHIIKRLEGKTLDDFETVKPRIKQMIANDERGHMAKTRKQQLLAQKYNVQRNEANIEALWARMANGMDSTFVAQSMTSETPLATIGDEAITVGDLFSKVQLTPNGLAEQQTAMAKEGLEKLITNRVLDLERDNLANENEAYRNLLNEYRDGMLLFEISDRNVWSKAKQDVEGLNSYFRANRANYTWDKPRFKSYVVFATSDSLLSLAKDYLAKNMVASDSLGATLRRQFGRDIKVERVLAAQGENAITDYLGFNGPKPEAKGKWAYYFPYNYRVISAPEEALDERGAVTTDYQAVLEQEWLKDLAKKYPAKVNKKVFKKAK